MSRYTAEYWKDRADEARAIGDTMASEEPRRIMAEIAVDFDRLHDWTLKQSGPLNRQQAIEVLVSDRARAALELINASIPIPALAHARRGSAHHRRKDERAGV